MITVSIDINGRTIFARSARNQDKKDSQGFTKYVTDAGDILWHLREDGTISLAHKMLNTIQEHMDETNSKVILRHPEGFPESE